MSEGFYLKMYGDKLLETLNQTACPSVSPQRDYACASVSTFAELLNRLFFRMLWHWQLPSISHLWKCVILSVSLAESDCCGDLQ